ncbi:selenium-dependent molybdenum cofactor biosynthesis protein YqeB [Coprobacillus sp. AF33-1AC]|nr:selenium-dependent molybdenum cofactor biosynthesis protein YqeB [Coprobacillus sp. AF33-1AC]
MNMNNLIIVRGGGDIATGTIYKLYQCGFDVLILEVAKPSAIRRNVAFCEAIYDTKKTVENLTCYLAHDRDEVKSLLSRHQLTLFIDPEGTIIQELKPLAVVDAILAKKNLGTKKDMAPITVGLGPGFEAGKDVDAVIETMRGHQLGRIIYQGTAINNTGVPGLIQGYGKERVIHSPCSGKVKHVKKITDIVKKGEIIAYVDKTPIYATLDGLLRGLIKENYVVTKGFKMADIDPRVNEYQNCFTISDKARCIAGGVVEAILHLKREKYDLS